MIYFDPAYFGQSGLKPPTSVVNLHILPVIQVSQLLWDFVNPGSFLFKSTLFQRYQHVLVTKIITDMMGKKYMRKKSLEQISSIFNRRVVTSLEQVHFL